MSHCRLRAAATSRPAGSHEYIYRHSFRDACKYFVGAAAGHITLKVAASRRSLHACAPACSAFARQAFVPRRVKICLSKTLPSHYLLAACSGCARVLPSATAAAAAIVTYVSQLCRKSDSACPPHAAAPAANHLTSPQVCAPFEGPVLRAAEVAYHCHRPQHTAHHWQHDFNCWCRETCSAAPPRACGCRCAWSFLA